MADLFRRNKFELQALDLVQAKSPGQQSQQVADNFFEPAAPAGGQAPRSAQQNRLRRV